MKEMLLHKRIGLFHLDVTQFQKDCLPFPEKVLEAVGRHLPVIAAKRNDVLLNVIKVSTCLTSSFWFSSALNSRFFVAVFSVVSCYNCNNIQLSPEGEVNSGGYIPRREASRYISTALHRP